MDALAGNNGQASRVWFGNGAGSFTQGVQALTSSYTYDIALGDLDMDGDIDFFAANYNQADRVWLNNGDGTFTDSGQSLGSSRSQTVTLGDADGDGDLDAFVGNWAQPAQLWLNDGHASFTASSKTLESEMCTAAAFADLNQDGFLDVFLGTVIGNRVWTNNGFGVFSDSGQDLGNAVTYGIALGDVDNDGDFDAYAANSGEPHILWLNDGHGGFSDSGQPLSTTFANQAAFGDVNGDGDLDIVLANDWQQPAEVWTNSGAGLFYNSGQRMGNKSRYSVALGDVDGDGDLDVFFGNNGSCDVWLNDLVSFTLTGVAGAHGIIIPEGNVTVAAGGSTSFVARADTYYWIDTFTILESPRVEAAHAQVFTCLWDNVYCDGTASVTFSEALAAHGTPEIWLAQYGWTDNFDYWESQDTDGDAFQAWEEQVAGTDPTNAASYFKVTSCGVQGSGKVLNWNGVSGRVYSIFINTNSLVTGPWSPITSNLPPTGTWTDTTYGTSGKVNYRLGVKQEP
ncbi:MAG: VCBS repeat-containing protein [Spartobacteria bacterium]|nr:VCBS repeat-containing protein [Spartobacteria bacterium]